MKTHAPCGRFESEPMARLFQPSPLRLTPERCGPCDLITPPLDGPGAVPEKSAHDTMAVIQKEEHKGDRKAHV